MTRLFTATALALAAMASPALAGANDCNGKILTGTCKELIDNSREVFDE